MSLFALIINLANKNGCGIYPSLVYKTTLSLVHKVTLSLVHEITFPAVRTKLTMAVTSFLVNIKPTQSCGTLKNVIVYCTA